MPIEKEAVWTTFVLLFWFWPMLLALGYVAVASVWAVVRVVRGYGAHLEPQVSEHPAPSGGS